MRERGSCRLSALALLLALSGVWGGVAAQSTDDPSDAEIRVGEELFGGVGLCFACHGVGGVGIERVAPNLTDNEWLHGDGSLVEILKVITAGVLQDSKTGGIMPAKGGSSLTDQQLRAVSAYVWSLSRDTPPLAMPLLPGRSGTAVETQLLVWKAAEKWGEARWNRPCARTPFLFNSLPGLTAVSSKRYLKNGR